MTNEKPYISETGGQIKKFHEIKVAQNQKVVTWKNFQGDSSINHIEKCLLCSTKYKVDPLTLLSARLTQ